MTALPKMDAFWLPYSSNENFRAKPRLIAKAKDMHYYDIDGRKMLDACAGLWCCNAGHNRDHIVQAIQKQAETLDFSPTFQYGHPKVFEFSEKLAQLFPDPLNTVFLSNSGSEAADSSLKIALAYHRLRGNGQKQLFIGRERAYHGVGFGGISVGGIVKNRLWFGNQMLRVDHLPHTHYDVPKNTRGEPAEGGEASANKLLDLIALHDASTIAAVIVEPVAGSTGVLPPPTGYLKRLREICDAHDILLIFDEVITCFGRLSKTSACEYFGVVPDILNFAKGATSGTVPLGGNIIKDEIRRTFLDATKAPGIDLFHGYTYSGHPLAVAAGVATLELYEKEGLLDKGAELVDYFADGVHSLKDYPNVTDTRNIGFMGAIDLAPLDGMVGKRAMQIMEDCFHNRDLVIRVAGDTIALSPPLMVEKSHIDETIEKIAAALKAA